MRTINLSHIPDEIKIGRTAIPAEVLQGGIEVPIWTLNVCGETFHVIEEFVGCADAIEVNTGEIVRIQF